MKPVTIYAYREDQRAVLPEVAYDNTSACFDITAIQDTIIPAGGSAVVENGLRLSIDESEKYWMQIQLRSSKGFKYSLIPHYGTVDAGYTGPLGVKIYNVGKEDIKIEAGERYAQIAVIPKPDYSIKELNSEEFEMFKNSQGRGDKGFGSSGAK